MRRTYRNLLITTLIMMSMLVGCFGGSKDEGSQTVVENPGYGILKGSLKGDDVAGALVIAEPLVNGETLTVSKIRNTVAKDSPSLIYTQANENGDFEMKDVPVGEYFVQAKKGQTTIGQVMKVSVRQEAPTALNIQVTATGSISGLLFMNGKTNHNGIMAYLLGTSYLAVTDASGAYKISDVPVGSYTMEVWAGYGYETLQQAVSVTAGANTSASSMTLNIPTISGTIYGKVIDQSGSPITGATLEIKTGATTVGTTTSDSNGDYNVSGLVAGSYQIVSSKTGLTSVYIPTVIISPERKDINAPNLVMFVSTGGTGTGNIEGYVLDETNGTPISGASVEVRFNQHILGNVFTDASGHYTFSNIAAGNYVIYGYKTGYWDEDVFGTVVSGTTEIMENMLLEVDNSTMTPGNIAGQVKYYDNTPVSNGTVEVCQNNVIVSTTTTDLAGNYSFASIPPGVYTVKAYDPSTMKMSYVIATVFSGATINPDFIMIPKIQIGRITGYVRNQFFTPVIGASVEVYDVNNSFVTQQLTDSSGYYSFDNINEGVYRVDINTGGMITESRTVEVIVGVLLVPDVIIKSKPASLIFDTYEVYTSCYKGAHMEQLNPQVQYEDGTIRNVYYNLDTRILSGAGNLEGYNYYQPAFHGISTLEISYFENNTVVTNEVGIISTWEIQVVDNVNCQGDDLKIDRKGNIHIVYSDTGNSKIKHAMYDRKNWYITDVDTGNLQSPSLAIDDLDQLHVCYYDASAARLKYAQSPGGLVWPGSIYISDSGIDIGLYNDIIFDTQELPIIAAYNSTNTQPQFFMFNGSVWDSTEIEYVSPVGTYVNCELSNEGRLDIVFSAGISLTKLSPLPFGFIDTDEVVSASGTFTYSDIEYDPEGIPLFAFKDPDMNAIRIRREYSPGMFEFLAFGGILTPVGTGDYVDLEVGDKGSLFLAYQDSGNQDLYVSIDYTGLGTFISSDIDSVGNVGSNVSMELYDRRMPVISYVDTTNNTLKVAFY